MDDRPDQHKFCLIGVKHMMRLETKAPESWRDLIHNASDGREVREQIERTV